MRDKTRNNIQDAGNTCILVKDKYVNENYDLGVDIRYLVIGEGIKRLLVNPLSNNHCLEQVIFPDKLEVIGDDVFNGCTNLKFSLPKHIASIGKRAFSGVRSNVELRIPGSVRCLENNSFSYGRYSDVFLESGVLFIKEGCFRNTSIENLYVPNTVVSIESYNFNYVKNVYCYKNSAMEEYYNDNYLKELGIKLYYRGNNKC